MSGPSFDHADQATVNPAARSTASQGGCHRSLLPLACSPFEPRTEPFRPDVEGAVELGPGVQRRRAFAPAIDPGREELVRPGIADLALDGRARDEATQLGIERTLRRYR